MISEAQIVGLIGGNSDRILFFVNDTSSVGSFVNIKNGAACQLQVKALLVLDLLEFIKSDENKGKQK